MAKNLPINKGDPSLIYGDTGAAVKKLQEFLNNTPFKQKEIALMKDFNQDFSLTRSAIYGNFERETSAALMEYQRLNKPAIMQRGQMSEADFEKEKGTLGFATWSVMQGGQDVTIPTPPSSQPSSPNSPTSPPIDIPAGAQFVKGATHFVKTRNPSHRLALRESPAWSAVGKEVNEDEDKKGKLVFMMPQECTVYVVEPGVGYHCEWHQVELLGNLPTNFRSSAELKKFEYAKELQKTKKLYCYAEFVQPLPGIPDLLPMNCIQCSERKIDSKPMFMIENWPEFDHCFPWYDTETCSYYIVTTLNYEVTSDELLAKYKQEAIALGTRHLLNFYDKQRDEFNVTRLLSAYRWAEIPANGWYLDQRPGSKIKFLVKVQSKYFDAIPRATDYMIDIPNIETGKLPSGYKTANYYSNRLKSNIAIVRERFFEYVNDIEDFDGSIDLDLEEEANNLEHFYAALKDFVDLNGYVLNESEEHLIEFGFGGECYELLYVIYDGHPLRIGLDCFLSRDVVKNNRTMGFIFYLDEMIEDIESSVEREPWITFAQKYTCPIPKVKPSEEIEQAPEIQLKKEIKKMDEKSVKTTEEKIIEDAYILDPEFQYQQQKRRQIDIDFVGDNMFDCEQILRMLDKVQDFDDIYKQILNKTNLSTVALFVASCISAKLHLGDLEAIICDMIYRNLPSDKFNKLLELLPTEELQKANDYMATLPKNDAYMLEHYEIDENDQMVEKHPGQLAAEEASMQSMRVAIDKSIPKVTICKGITLLDPDLVASYMNKMLAFLEELRKFIHTLPTISLPQFIFTIDIMDIIGPLIYAIEKALTKALMSVVKFIFSKICKICGFNLSPKNDENFGDDNFNDLMKDRNLNPKKAARDFLDDLNQNDTNGNPINPDDILNFLDDLSSLLTPTEICNLLNGIVSDELLKIVKELVAKKYPQLSKMLGNRSAIKTFFMKLNNYIDPKFCSDLKSRIPQEDSSIRYDDPTICGLPDLRKNLLEGRMSPEQLKQQLAIQKQNDIDQLKQLLDIAAKDVDFLKDLLPSATDEACKRNSMFNNVLKNQESFRYLNDKVQNSMFDSVKISFNQDMQGYIQAMEQIVIPEPDNVSEKSLEHQTKVRAAHARMITDFRLRKKYSEVLDEKGNPTGDLMEDKDGKIKVKRADDVALILDDPDMMGISKSQIQMKILPELQAALKDEKTLKIINLEKRIAYSLYLQQVDPLLQEEKFNNMLSQGDNRQQYIQVLEFMKSLNSTKELEDELTYQRSITPGEMTDTQYGPNLSGYSDLENTKMIDSKMVEYRLLESTGDNNTQNIEISVGELSNNKDIFINGIVSLKDIAPSLDTSFTYPFDSSVPNSKALFKSFIGTKWLKVLDDESKKNIRNLNSTFSKFWNEKFDETTEWLFKQFLDSVSRSKLFNPDIFQSIEWTPEMDETSVCTYNAASQNTLLKIEDVSSDVKKDFDKKLNSQCPQRNDMQESSKKGVVNLLIRTYCIEQLLKSVFTFTQYKVEDIYKGGTFQNYLSKKIITEFKDHDASVYNSVIKELKKIDEEKNRTVLPINQKFGVEGQYSESGEKMLESLISDNLLQLSDSFANLLGTKDKENLYKTLIARMIPNINILTSAQQILDFLTNRNASDKGMLVLESYKKQCDGETEFIMNLNAPLRYTANGIKVCYGLRLVYLMPPSACNGLRMNKDDIWSREFIFQQGPASCPLIKIEQEEFMGYEPEIKQTIFNELYDKMIASEDFKFLFEYVFPAHRILSIITMYNINVVGRVSDEFEGLFESTKNSLRQLMEILDDTMDEKWWKREQPDIDGVGHNMGIMAKMNGNITTKGPTINLAKMAALTPIMILKGLAEKIDPAYRIIKKRDYPLNLRSLFKVMPINIFGPFIGFGPPITPLGLAALSAPMLTGEKKKKKKKDRDDKLKTETQTNAQSGAEECKNNGK